MGRLEDGPGLLRMGADPAAWQIRAQPRFFFGATLVSGDAEFGLSFGDFSFVPIKHFHDRHPSGHIMPPSHAQDIYKRTVFEKNSFSFVNNHLVNEGVPVSVVEKGTGTHITPFAITEEHLRPGEPIHSSTLSKNKLTIYKPSISTAAPQSPLMVKERFAKNASGYGQIITPQTNPRSWQTLQNGRQNAAEQAAKNQRAVAQAAQTEKNRLDQEGQKEANQSKQAALKGEEAVQAMKAQKAQQHVQRAQSWTPPKEIIVPKISQPVQQAAPRTEPVRAENKQAVAKAPENKQPVAISQAKPPQEIIIPRTSQPTQQVAVHTAPAPAENKQAVTKAPENKQPVIIPPVNRPTEQFQAQVRELNSEARMEQQRKETVESTVRTQAQSQWQQQQQPHQEAPPRKEAGRGR